MAPERPIRPNFFKIFRFLWEFFTEKPVPTPPGVDEWISKRFDALRAQSRENYLETIHPDCRAALDDSGPLGDLARKEFASKPLETWTSKVRLVQDREPLLMEDLLRYPVRPTHLVEAIQKTPNGSTSQVWYLVRQDDRWVAVLPVPKEGLAPRLAAQHAQIQDAKQRIEQLYYSADPGKLTPIRELIRQNRLIDAVKKAQSLFGLGLGEAKTFVDFMIHCS